MAAEMLTRRGAVVTGGGRGIGAAVALAIAGAGAGVVVAARTSGEIERVAGEIVRRGGKAWAVACDVTDEASVNGLGEQARARLGAIDVLVNNAGGSGSAPFAKLTLEDWNSTLGVNATGTFLCTREFAPDMVGRRWGRVINVASIAGLAGARYVAHYSAAKHAVIGFTRSVALELADTGVTVNAVCPGYADTPMTQLTLTHVQTRTGTTREQALAAVLASAGQDRLVTPEEVAAVVLALCAEDAAGRSGEAVVLGVEAPAR